ncbi:class I SAM-dependent methyltransferase [Winogradskyella ouciana]|uniref:Methyltransferase domain-containing protein n=1 Tax=Winogradskyella ouciana TaxID=2608631 RepID=A0A7K1GBU0_9FLAO|nr:class I SAM-dependent methyltransferase [Winogradskyella ouciana]MTE26757.1 methyltransferase domain-containing protein [Winogradskyella ouciana]
MDKDYEKKYHELEDSHFWFKSRRNFIIQLLKNENKNSKILDVGCSSGLLLMQLVKNGFDKKNLYGIDISEEAIENCRKNNLNNCFVMSGENIALNQDFDIIIASDCLEHIENDNDALKNWKQNLKENGKLYVFVPAFMNLWSNHDVVNMHFRRYTENKLTKMAIKCHLKIKKSGYWNITLFIPLYIIRKINKLFLTKKLKQTKGDLYHIGVLNKPLLMLLNLENKILKYFKFPFGISTYIIAEK